MDRAIPRFVVSYRGGSIELEEGTTLVGRGVECKLRFNDQGISRRHLRLVVSSGRLVIEDLGSTNGTYVNGSARADPVELGDGDVVVLGGSVRLAVSVLGACGDEAAETDAKGTLPPDFLERVLASLDDEPVPPEPPRRTCPVCRADAGADDEACPSCGRPMVLGVALRDTQEIAVDEIFAAHRAVDERRRFNRYAARFPVIYESQLMSCEGVSNDLSMGGIFVATDILDEVGTECTVTLLPDGAGALLIRGVVSRIATEPGGPGRPAGMGVRFTQMAPATHTWLATTLLLVRTNA